MLTNKFKAMSKQVTAQTIHDLAKIILRSSERELPPHVSFNLVFFLANTFDFPKLPAD